MVKNLFQILKNKLEVPIALTSGQKCMTCYKDYLNKEWTTKQLINKNN